MSQQDKDTIQQKYQRDGFIILENVVPEHTLNEMCDEARSICTGKRGDVAGTDALAGLSADEVMNHVISIHFPHKISPMLHELLSEKHVVEALTALVGANVKCMQSMFFVKHAGRPGQAWHQDESFIPTRDRSMIGVWIAVDNATVDNGCLWVIPGSHRPGILWQTRPQNDARFDHTEESFGYPYSADEAIPVELEAGSIVLFNGYLLHRSLNNTTEDGYRRSYVNHYMSAESLLPWTGGCLDHLVEDYRDIVMVAGEDPYAFKGTENLSVPYLRPANATEKAELATTIKL